jgi:F-type H+-transporting ATPase subunit a
MADPVLHIKDSYYFEVPKVLYPYEFKSAREFPDVWISLDPQFQAWEFERLYQELGLRNAGLPAKERAQKDWQDFVHSDHANFAKPFEVFLEEKYQAHQTQFSAWKRGEIESARKRDDGSLDTARALTFDDYLAHLKTVGSPDEAYLEFLAWRHDNATAFQRARETAGGREAIREWRAAVQRKEIPDWAPETIAAYNRHLSGKILIPQPFGTLRNLYERESGFAISKYMVLEVVIGLILLVVFQNLARKVSAGGPPRGYLWNLLESFLLFIRNEVVTPSIGGHHEEPDNPEFQPEHGHEYGDPYGEHGRNHAADGHLVNDPQRLAIERAHAHAQGHDHGPSEVTRMLPLFWTIFFFVLGCNLFGMLPWLGAPTASFSVTTGLALVTLVVGMYAGVRKFGLLGHLGNQIPSMDLPVYIAVIVKPLVYAIEVAGLMIKHGVLAIRLLANMVAGHLVILGIMGVAFGATAALVYKDAPSWQWPIAAVIAVVASTAFNLLELFVAFLQAYIFTFLSALFIGATLHKH